MNVSTFKPATALQTAHASALSNSLQRALRSLAEVPSIQLRLQVGRLTQDGAFTDGNAIRMEVSDPDVTSARSLVFILGLAYHEMGHVMFTPKDYRSRNADRFFHKAMNILEDQRMEARVVALYPAIVTYFKAAYARMITEHEGDHTRDYALAYGRRYLPRSVRTSARKMFVANYGEEKCKRVEKIIDAYRRLTFTRTALSELEGDEVEKLVNQFIAVLGWDISTDINDGVHGGSTVYTSVNQAAHSETLEKAEELVQADADEAEPEDAEADGAADATAADTGDDDEDGSDASGASGASADDDADPDDEGGDGAVDDADDDADDARDGGQDRDIDGDGGNPDDDTDDDGNADGGVSGDGAGDGKSKDLPDDDLQELEDDYEDAIDDLTYDVVNDRDLANDLKGWRDSITSGNEFRGVSVRNRVAPSQNILAGRKFADTISKALTPDIDPGWDGGYSSGRINMGKAMAGASYDELFDRWYEGKNDAFNIEAIVALDYSDSMKDRNTEVARTAWTIRNGIEQLANGACATIVWADDAQWLLNEGKQDTRIVSHAVLTGGTHAVPMLNMSLIRFMSAQRRQRNRVLFILTDGQWADENASKSIINELRSDGVVVVVAGLNMWPSVDGVDVKVNIRNVSELTSVAESVVSEIYKKISNGLGPRRV